jgi:hypothetical protein
METDLMDSLSMLTDEITKTDKEKDDYMKEWWDNNMHIDSENPESKITSSAIWIKFRQTNKDFINDYEITPDIFKNFIKTIIPYEKYTEKNKYGGTIELTGYGINQQREHKETKKIDNEDRIIESYNNTRMGVMEIAKKFDIETYKVVSLLVKNKVIKTRGDARGYDIYKESSEYKSKIVK